MATGFAGTCSFALRSAQCGDEVATCLFTISTLVSTGFAVLVVRCMAFALSAAHPAGNRTACEHCFGQLRVESGQARVDVRSDSAHVGAVEVDGDTHSKLIDRRLAEARIGALGARLCAIPARIEALRQNCREIVGGPARMGFEDRA